MPVNVPLYKPLERLGYVLFLLACLVAGITALGKGWYAFLALNNRGVTTDGVVVERDTSVKGDRLITYRYEAPSMDGGVQTFEMTIFVKRDFSVLPGDTISIVYLPERPQLSNIAGNRFLLFGDIVWVTIILGVVEGFVGVLLGLHVKEWREGK